MKKNPVKISYWIAAEGDDFEDIKQFESELVDKYEIEIDAQKSDACGGGNYEFILQILSDINLQDFLKDYAKDGIKAGIGFIGGFLGKELFQAIKHLFKKNHQLRPDIAATTLTFKDTEIIIYSTYDNSIYEVLDDVIANLSLHYPAIINRINQKIAAIHVPIFHHVDTYSVCAYRVKLDVDENIPNFTRDDYFRFWGVRCEDKKDFIYDLHNRTVIQERFYTQSEYDELLDRKFKEARQ